MFSRLLTFQCWFMPYDIDMFTEFIHNLTTYAKDHQCRPCVFSSFGSARIIDQTSKEKHRTSNFGAHPEPFRKQSDFDSGYQPPPCAMPSGISICLVIWPQFTRVINNQPTTHRAITSIAVSTFSVLQVRRSRNNVARAASLDTRSCNAGARVVARTYRIHTEHSP